MTRSFHIVVALTLSTILALQSLVVAAAATDPAFNSTTNRYRAINNIPYTSDGTCAITQDTGGDALTQSPSSPTLTPPGGSGATTSVTGTGSTTTGVTTYGGEFVKGGWLIDNVNQAYMIRGLHTTSEAQLDGKLTSFLTNLNMGTLKHYYDTQTWDEQNIDDNGFGAYTKNKLGMHHKAGFAIMPAGIYAGLGRNKKITVTYKGKTIVVESLDIGGASSRIEGYPRSVDLWWEAARALNFTEGSKPMQVARVPDNTPTTVIGDGAGASTGGCSPGGTGATGDCKATKPIWGQGSDPRKGQMPRGLLETAFGKWNDKKNTVSMNFMGKSVDVNKAAAGCLQAVLDEIKSRGINYTIREMGCFRTDNSPQFYHGYGAACDINPSTNGCSGGSCGNGVGGVGKTDIPKEMIDAFHNHGWSWGGGWSGIKDYMHFEFNGYDGQSGGTSP